MVYVPGLLSLNDSVLDVGDQLFFTFRFLKAVVTVFLHPCTPAVGKQQHWRATVEPAKEFSRMRQIIRRGVVIDDNQEGHGRTRFQKRFFQRGGLLLPD